MIVVLVGVMDKLTEGRVTIKFEELVAVPPRVETVITPVVAPDGTVAVI